MAEHVVIKRLADWEVVSVYNDRRSTMTISLTIAFVWYLKGILIDEGAQVLLSNLEIAANRAGKGGGLFISGEETSVTLDGVDITNNEALFGSGMHYCCTLMWLTLRSAIFVESSILTFVRGIVASNSGGGNSAALSCINCTLDFPSPNDVEIFGNGLQSVLSIASLLISLFLS